MKYSAKLCLIALSLALILGFAWKLESQEETDPAASTSNVLRPSPSDQQRQDLSSKSRQVTPQQAGDFTELASHTLRNLPSKDALHHLNENDAHQTPSILLQAAMEIGEIVEVLEARLQQTETDPNAHAKVIEQGLSFYRECALNSEKPTSVRALCYSHFRELRERSGHPETSSEADAVPGDVRSLVDLLAER
jgi:hypothetical protein